LTKTLNWLEQKGWYLMEMINLLKMSLNASKTIFQASQIFWLKQRIF